MDNHHQRGSAGKRDGADRAVTQNQWLMNFQRSLTPPPDAAPSSTEVVCTTFGRIVKCQ
jgi:hypothetical protein